MNLIMLVGISVNITKQGKIVLLDIFEYITRYIIMFPLAPLIMIANYEIKSIFLNLKLFFFPALY